jgi:hypothetical protein
MPILELYRQPLHSVCRNIDIFGPLHISPLLTEPKLLKLFARFIETTAATNWRIRATDTITYSPLHCLLPFAAPYLAFPSTWLYSPHLDIFVPDEIFAVIIELIPCAFARVFC